MCMLLDSSHLCRSDQVDELANSFLVCSYVPMELEQLFSILQSAPAWARLGLTVHDARLRERAADDLAATIVQRVNEPIREENRNQLALPL